MSGRTGPSGGDGPRRLLLVEDDAADAALVLQLLRAMGYGDVARVPTAHAALEALAEAPVDCVVLDLGLPDAQDFEALAAILSILDAPPVVVLTGASEDILGNTALQMGAEDFLNKDLLNQSAASALLDRSIRYAVTRHRQRTMLTRESAELRWLSARQRHFIDDVANGLMGPVTALYGLAATLAERHRNLSSNERRMLLEKIASNAQQISSRLGSFMEDARPGSTLMAPRTRVSLAEIVPAAINSVTIRPADATVRVEGDLPTVWAHGDALQRAITALVTNAMVHGPPGRVVEVVVTAERYGRGLRIAVADNGRAVPLPRRPSMFEPGVKLDEDSPGPGLGLALVRAVVAEHGGAVWIDDSPLGGTQVTFTIPQREFSRMEGERLEDVTAAP